MTSLESPAGFGVRNASFSRGKRTILRDVNFSVLPGEIHALVGGHHEGKSALCDIMGGRLAPDAGEVTVPGQSFPALTAQLLRQFGVADLSAISQLDPRLSVLENLLADDSPWWKRLFTRSGRRRGVAAWLAENGIELPLASRMEELPREQWPLVGTLRRLYLKPRLLIVDEALEELPRPWLDRVMAMIRRHAAGGMAALLVTHRIEDALALADRVTVMRQGSVILSNTAADMDRLNLIRLCYARLDDGDEADASQERFRESLLYTEAVLRDLPTAVVILDLDLNVRFANRAAEEIVATVSGAGGELFGPANPELRGLVLAAAGSGETSEHRGVSVTAGDRRLSADVTVRPIVEKGVKVGSMVVIEDVSLREDLRRRLTLSERQASIGLLAAGVAHEVNNPLEVLGNYLDYLGEVGAAPDVPEVLSRMEDELARIHEIVGNLASNGGGRRADEIVDAMALVREIGGLLSLHEGFKEVEFACGEADGRTMVTANSSELRQIFLHLIRNSLDAMPEGGRISVASRVHYDRGQVEIRVGDTGPGIGLDNPNDVFQPYFTTKKGIGGHQGLGLSTVCAVIEKYGGSIGVRNLPEGGCEFTIFFPLAKTL